MSNNKQIMKLYTEEQVRKAIELAQECDYDGYYPVHFDYSQTEILQHLTPIELPSDDELKKQFDVDEFDPYDLAYLGGAIRMRNLIQGDNK